MSKRIACILALVLITSGLTVFAGPITGGISFYADEVLAAVRVELDSWAESPLDATGCNAGDCCDTSLGEVGAPATEVKCVAFAQNYVSNKNFWARQLFECLADDGDWACDHFVAQGTDMMVCQTMPAAGLLRKKDVADCATKVTAVQN